MKRLIRLAAVAALSIGWQVAAVPATQAAGGPSQSSRAASSSCHLGNGVQHVINIVFDNTHFTRDNPNVPSDLEQMPHLLNFLQSNGTLLTNEHTPLISHTATDILTALTGVYGDQMGVPVSNSFRYFNPNGSTNLGVSFAYWTDPLFDPTTSAPTDTQPNMLTAAGKNAPAPWVPFTRAGCNVGGAGTANIELENIATDIPTVFGAGSPEAQEVTSNPTQAFNDFVGIAVHCAQGNALCSNANNGRADLLKDEPGGYTGFNGLFGHKYVAPALGGITTVDGATPITGFPGFDGMSAKNTLGYVAAMQEHGVPVTYAYISDAHDKHPTGPAYGPGQAGYVAALKSYDDAFAAFFGRLASDGINKSNTLFTVTADEGDHFAGVQQTGCDGVTTPCVYGTNQIGEVNTNMAGLLATEQGVTTPFTVHSDDAPAVYITGNPAHDAAVTRTFERATGALTAVNPYTGNTENPTRAIADPAEMKLLHMITADPARTPTFTWFANPDYFLFAGARNCNSPCVSINPGFAWNHGTIGTDINVTWLGLVGPDVRNLGATHDIWTDHSDIRPTILALTGLQDDYAHAGRPITEVMTETRQDLNRLAAIYKQINAPVGQLALDSAAFATNAIKSNSAGDQTYLNADNTIQSWTSRRDALAAQMIALLDFTAPGGSTQHNDRNVNDLINAGQSLLDEVHAAAG
ncbi:MAG: hypothetical protein E6I81_10820 [Chloroflexi bacterium]|nr:MAG: hypothetical protein E6I81_10820 [Chloroflexota bacterium]